MDPAAALPSGLDQQSVLAGLVASVPFVRTLGIEFLSVGLDDVGRLTAKARLPDAPSRQNHVGGPHAGVMFTLGESTSGAVVAAGFGDLLPTATPLAVNAEIRYRRLTNGDLTAVATMDRRAVEIRDELAAGRRPKFAVQVVVSTDQGETARLTVNWVMWPHPQG